MLIDVKHDHYQEQGCSTSRTSAVTARQDITEAQGVIASDWFSRGKRVPYDRRTKEILAADAPTKSRDIAHVFRRIEKDAETDANAVWTSFLPGWPDGSFGWAKVDQQLAGKRLEPKLFVEYVGHGDSDKPTDHPYGTGSAQT